MLSPVTLFLSPRFLCYSRPLSPSSCLSRHCLLPHSYQPFRLSPLSLSITHGQRRSDQPLSPSLSVTSSTTTASLVASPCLALLSHRSSIHHRAQLLIHRAATVPPIASNFIASSPSLFHVVTSLISRSISIIPLLQLLPVTSTLVSHHFNHRQPPPCPIVSPLTNALFAPVFLSLPLLTNVSIIQLYSGQQQPHSTLATSQIIPDPFLSFFLPS